MVLLDRWNSSESWRTGWTTPADLSSYHFSWELEREGRAFRSELECIFGYMKARNGEPARIEQVFVGKEADGPLEQPLEPPMASRRPELGMDGSPLESEKRPVQFGRERSIA